MEEELEEEVEEEEEGQRWRKSLEINASSLLSMAPHKVAPPFRAATECV